MIIKSANLMALSALLAPEESLMEKEATARAAGRMVRGFKPKAKQVRKKVMRQPAVQAHNAQRGAGKMTQQTTQQTTQQAAPAANPTQNPFNTQGDSFSGGTSGGTMQWNMPQPGPSFRAGAANVGQGFREMGDSIVQGGKNLVNRGMQAGANAARTVGNAISTGAKATGNYMLKNPSMPLLGGYMLYDQLSE